MKRVFFGFMLLSTILYFFNPAANSLGQAGDTYKLKYKMKKGESLNYSTKTDVESIQEIMGSEMTSNSQIQSNIHITSEGNDQGGNLIFVVKYESLEIDMYSSVMGDTSFHNPPGLVGKRVKKIITPYGDQIQSIEVDSMKSLPFMPQFSSSREILPTIPANELKIGESVSATDIDTTKMMSGSTISKTSTEYTLVGKESKSGFNCLKINFKGTITLEGDGITHGMNFFIEGDGNHEGTLYFAPESGLLVASESVMDMEMTAAVTGQQNMTIPITQTVNAKMALIK